MRKSATHSLDVVLTHWGCPSPRIFGSGGIDVSLQVALMVFIHITLKYNGGFVILEILGLLVHASFSLHISSSCHHPDRNMEQ